MDHVDCFKLESFAIAQKQALRMKDELGENFNIVEIKQVWTTTTLDEAFNVMSTIDPDYADSFERNK